MASQDSGSAAGATASRSARRSSSSGAAPARRSRGRLRTSEQAESHVQERTFKGWINFQLEKHDPPVQVIDLFADLRSGVNLIYLLEVLTGKKFPVEKRSAENFHRINVNFALDFLRRNNVLKAEVNVSSILEGSRTLTLGLIWQVLLHYQIIGVDMQHSHDNSKLLLGWVQSSLQSEGSGIEVNSFASKPFHNGLAFSGILACHKPELVDMKKVKDQEPVDRLSHVFEVAMEHLNVPPLLSAEDVAKEMADDKSIMVYTAELYNVLPHDVPDGKPAAAGGADDIDSILAQIEVLHQRLISAGEAMKAVELGKEFHALKSQLDEHQEFMKQQLGSTQESQIVDLQQKTPKVAGKLPKGNPNKKKAQKALFGLLTGWNEVNKDATDRQTEMLERLAQLQDTRLKKVEDWLEHLEEEQAKDATPRPDVLQQRERELVDYQEVLTDVIMVDTSAQGKKDMDDRLAAIRQRWEIVNRFVLLRILQVFRGRLKRAAEEPGVEIEEIRAVVAGLPSHKAQLQALQDSINNLKETEPTSRHDPYLDKVDGEVQAMAEEWTPLEDAVKERLEDYEHDEAMAQQWQQAAPVLLAFLDDANNGLLKAPLPVHDLDAVNDMHKKHQDFLKDMDHRLQNVKNLDRDLSDPKLKKQVDDLFAEVDTKWTNTKDLAEERQDTLQKSQVQLQDFESQVEDIAAFLNEIEPLFLKPLDELPRDEQVSLLAQLKSAKEKFDERKPAMAGVQLTSADLVSRSRAASFDPSDLEAEVQTLVERWEDAEVLLDQRLSAHSLGFSDWVAELEAKRKEIPTAPSLVAAAEIVEGIDEEIQRSAYQFPELQGQADSGSLVERFQRVDSANDTDVALLPEAKQVDKEVAEFLSMMETVEADLDAVKSTKAIDSEDDVKQLLERLENIDGVIRKLNASSQSLNQRATDLIAKASPEFGTAVETHTEKVLKMYADLEDESSTERARLDKINDFLEELSVQERWLDVAEQCYPLQKSGKVKDAQALTIEIDEHAPQFEHMADILPEVKVTVDDDSGKALDDRHDAALERFNRLRVGAGIVSPQLAAFVAACEKETANMNDLEAKWLVDPDDSDSILPAIQVIAGIERAEREELPPLHSSCDALQVQRDELVPTLSDSEKPQANEAYGEVDAKLTSLKPSLEHRRREMHPYSQVEREVEPLEGKVDKARGSLRVLHMHDDKADAISHVLGDLEPHMKTVGILLQTSGHLRDASHGSTRAVVLHERVEKLRADLEELLGRLMEEQEVLAAVALKELMDPCDALLLEGDRLLAALKAERPVATDISVLQDQFASLAELQKMSDKAQADGAELTAQVRLKPENVQESMKDKLDELNVKLTALFDALIQRESALENQMEQAQSYNDELSGHVTFLEATQLELEGLNASDTGTVEQLNKFQDETEEIARGMAEKRTDISSLDENYEKLMEVSLEEDCKETKSSLQELHQLFDAVMDLLRKRIATGRDVAGLGPLNLEELLAELAELREWLQAVEKWLIGQEHESDTFSDPTKAEQQRQKYEAVKDDLIAKKPALDQVKRDVALLLLLEPPAPELTELDEEEKSVSNYHDEVWKMVDKLQRLLEKAMPQQMVGMGDWLGRVNDWLRAQNPGLAIANGADDGMGMLEDLRKCELDLADRNPIMTSIMSTCQSRLNDPEMTEEATETLRNQMEKLQQNFDDTLAAVQMKEAWLQYYEHRGLRVKEGLTKQLVWFNEREQNPSLFTNPAVDLPLLENQIKEHGEFVASVQAQITSLTLLKHVGTVLMLQATTTSPPTPTSSPLGSPEATDLSEYPSSFPPLPSCKLNEAFTQLLARLQNLLQKGITHQHKLDDAKQQLHELLASMATFCEWIAAAEEKIGQPLGERGQMKVLQQQLEVCLGLKAEIPTQLAQVQQINSNCSEFLDSSTGPDQNSSFMISLTKLNDDWAQLQVKLGTRQADVEERMQGSSMEAIQFASDHAAALEWMICMEDQLSTVVAVNADLPDLLSHNKRHTELLKTVPARQMEVDRLHEVGQDLVTSGQLTPDDQASVENQMASLDSHWDRILNDSDAKSEKLAAALLVVNHVYDELKNFKEFILDAEDTLACADTIGGKNLNELQDLMASVAEREPAFDELMNGGDDLVKADTEIAASSALKLELFQVENRWKSIKLRLAKWAKQLGLDKDFYKLLADLLDWLSMAEAKVSRPNPSVTQIAAINDMLNELTDLKDSLENTQRPLLAEAETAQQQLERSARSGGDEEKEVADHAKREIDEVTVRMDVLAKDLDAKIMSLRPEPRVQMVREEQTESVLDFGGLLSAAPPGTGGDSSSWLNSAEKRLARPLPAYSIPAMSQRLSELETLSGEVDEHRPQYQDMAPSGGAWGQASAAQDKQAKLEAADEVALGLGQRFGSVETESGQQHRRTEDILRQLKKLQVDTAQVEYWLREAHPIADLVDSGDTIDGPRVQDVETARAQLPKYQLLLATATVNAELLDTDQPDGAEESDSVSAIVKKLGAMTDEMSEVAEKLMRDGKRINEKDLEELAILLGSIEDEYQRLMRWLADLTDVLTQPLPSGADIDFLAIEAALKSAKEIKKSLEVTNRPERLQFSGKCDDLIDRFSGSADGQDVAGKRDGVNDKWDEVIALCNRRIDDLRCMQTQLPPPVQVEGMPPPPPTSPDASAKKLLDWLNSFEIPRVAVGDTASCKMVAAYVKAVDRYMDAKSSNYLSATDEGDDNEAETIAALESKWSSTQEAAKNTSKVLPGVTEESEEFESNYLPLFERLTNAHGLVTGTVQDGEKEYCQASVVDRQRQCKEVHECDWQLEILPVHQSGQLLAKKYDTTPSCSTPPIRLRLQQLAALLSTVESSSKSHLERLAEVVGLWAEVAEGDKELEPVLRRVDECAALAEPVPTTKAGVDAQLPEMKALLASVDEFQTLVDKFKVLYNELCKHYPPLDTQPLHRIIEHSIDAYNTRRAAVDTRLKELDLARMWHEKIFDRLKGILLWIAEQQKLLGICKKMATFSGVSLVVPDEQQPRPLESIKQQEQPVENAIQSADLYLKLGRQDDPVLTRPAGMDDKHLNLVDSEVAEANVTWPTLKHDARSWDDGLHRARRLFGDFKPTMDKFEEEMTAAGNELAQQPKVAERNKAKLQEQLKWHDMFEAQLADLLELGDLMDRQHQPLPADHVEFAEDLQKHYDDLHKQLDALKRASEQRGKALREALAQLPSGLDWVPGHLPGSWVRGENTKLVPFFFDTENCIAQWEHPVLHDWRLALSGYNYVRFASYRAALKLRELRRKTYMNTVPFQLVQEVISERGLEQQNDTYISVMSAGNTLSLMYKKLQDMGHDRIDNDESSDILLSFLFSVYDTNRCGEIRAMSLKLFLLVLCSGPVVEKIRWLSSQQTDGLGRLDRRTVANILYDANMITKFVFESGHFGNTIVDQAVEECFRQSPKSNRVIRPPDLAEWLTLQPRVLNWLWSLEKLTRSEQVDHEVTCVFCDRNIRGLRYRCKKHTSDNMCQDCFWEGRHNDQHKLYHLVQEYTSTASVSERVRDVTQSIKRKGRRSLHRAGAADVAKDFNVLQFVADADHVDRPMMLTEAFTELYPAASAPRRASSPARMRADSPSAAASPTKSAQTPSNKSSSDEAAMRANLDEDARHLQMLIDQRHKLTDSLPSISTVVPNSSRLQRLMGEQLKEEISVLEHHHSRALSTLDTSKAKGTGYRPGQRDSTMATPTSSTSESPHPEYPIFDMLDIFSTQVTDALTEKQPHTAVPMPNGYNDLCNGLQETSHGMSNIVRDCSTASSTNSSGGNMPLDNSRLSRYYVSECGSGKAINDPHRIQVSSDPPRKPWMSKFSFVAYPGHRPGTQRIYVLKSENPLRYRLSLHNQFGSWKDVFSFYAFGSPQPGRLPIFVSTRGSDENSTDPMCFLLSDSEGDRNSALASGWTASFTFYTPPESAVLSISSPPVNGHTNGGSAFSPFSPISPL